ncbi:MAG: hypothetical protein LBS25_03440, partial [Candidatus Symbiothrix sp.]|jgi:hypothetical protein|nr:hypothetical protein [Candidatus Symbiothrix sp.]
MQALISVDNSLQWDTIWDASIGDFNDANIEDFMNNAWYQIGIPLGGYAGKSIRLAFRLVGDDAQSSAIDHISVCELAYDIPQGFFYGGLDKNGAGFSALMMGAAYTPTVWSTSVKGAEGYLWTLPDIEGTGSHTSAEAYSTAVYIHDAYYFPSLSLIYSEELTEPYVWAANAPAIFGRPVFFIGGNYNDWLRRFEINTADGKLAESFGVGNYNLLNNIDTIALSPKNYLFGTDSLHLKTAFGNYFDKPAHAYHLKGVRIATAKMTAPAKSELTLTVYRINANGEIQDVLATSKWQTDEAILDSAFYTLEFKTDIVVEDAVLMALSGFTDKPGLQFCVYSETMQSNGISNTYIYTDDNQWVSSSEILTNGLVPALCFTLDLDYSFIASENNDYRFAAVTVGDTKSFKLKRWADFDEKWSDQLPLWVSSDLSENENGEMIYTLTVTDELPEGIEARWSDAILTDGRGAKTHFTIAQGPAPWKIKSLNDSRKIFIRLVNDNFELQYPPETFDKAEIFDISGKSFGKYSLSNSGQTLLPASAYPHGVYLIGLSGKINQTLRIIK